MSSNDHSPLGLTCPAGGTFYVCAEAVHRFIGCCWVDACLPNGCPAGQLQATSFSASTPLAPDQECNAGQFYTCADTKPSFWGCCMTNPCTAGECAATDLAGAMLSSNPALAAPYLRGSPAQSLNSSTGTSSSSAPASGSESPSDHHQKAPISAIIGASLGAFFLALLCFIGIYFIFRRRAASKKANTLKHGSQGTEATLFNADSKFAYCGTPQMSYVSPGESDAGTYVYNPHHSGSPVMSVKVPEGPSVQSHGHRRHSTVSSLGAQTTRYSPPIGGQIQELDGGLTQFETIAELPAERSPGIVPDATPGAIDEFEAVGMQPSTTYTAYAPRGT